MSDEEVVTVAVCFLMVAVAVAGLYFGQGMVDELDEFDKICYEQDPDWEYKGGSAIYWNDSLKITCEEHVNKFGQMPETIDSKELQIEVLSDE